MAIKTGLLASVSCSIVFPCGIVFGAESPRVIADPISEATALELALGQLSSLQSVGMAWWASSVVFCASIIAAIWVKRDDLQEEAFLPALRVAIGSFFISIVVFGLIMTAFILVLGNDVAHLPSDSAHLFSKHFTATSIAYGIATTSFLIVTISWFKLMRLINPPEVK